MADRDKNPTPDFGPKDEEAPPASSAPAYPAAAPAPEFTSGCERCGEPCGGAHICGTCLAIEAEAKAKADADAEPA